MISPYVIVSDLLLNLNAAYNLEILKKCAWKGNNVSKHRVYIDEEESGNY